MKNRTIIEQLLAAIDDPFVFVVPEFGFRSAIIAIQHEREFDVIHDETINYFMSVYLSSEEYIPDRTVNRFNRVTLAMKEAGLYEFYWDCAHFIIQYRGIKLNEHSFQFRQISFQQLYFLFLQYCTHVLCAIGVFSIECIWYHLKRGKFNKQVHRIIGKCNKLRMRLLSKTNSIGTRSTSMTSARVD